MSSRQYKQFVNHLESGLTILTGPIGLSGSVVTHHDIKGVSAVATGSAGVGSYVVSFSDTYPKLLSAQLTFGTLLANGANIVPHISSSFSSGSVSTFGFNLMSGSSKVTPPSGSMVHATFFLKNSSV